MKKSVSVKSAALLSAAALLVSATAVQAAPVKRQAKLQCIAYHWDASDTGSTRGDCVQYRNKYKKT